MGALCGKQKQKKQENANGASNANAGNANAGNANAEVNAAWNEPAPDQPIVEQKQKVPIPNVKLNREELDTIGVARVYAGLKDTAIGADDVYFEFFDCFSETMWNHIKVGISCNTTEAADSTDRSLITFAQRGHCNVGRYQQKHNVDEPGLIRFASTEQRKRLSTIIENAVELEGKAGYNKRLLIQGDPHAIKDCCPTYLGPNGLVKPLSEDIKGKIGLMIDNYA